MKLNIIERDSNYVATIVRLPELKKVEGLVIRRDGQEGYSAYKLKSQLFLVGESKQLDVGGADLESNA